MHDEAIAHAEEAVRLAGRAPFFVGFLGHAYAHAGRRTDAETILEELRTRCAREYVPPMTLALVAMALGDTDPALEWLEQEYRDRGILLWATNAAVWFDDLRSDPPLPSPPAENELPGCFAGIALLRRMNYPQ